MSPTRASRSNRLVSAGAAVVRRALRLLRRGLRRAASAGIEPTDAELIARSALFDAAWYLDRYPSVRAGGADPIERYLAEGGREGHATSPSFDGGVYLEINPDVAEAGQNPLAHYLRNGREEGRILPRVRETTPGVPASRDGPPYYGRVLDGYVAAAAARRHRDSGEIEGYDTIAEAFDPAYYLLRYKDIGRAERLDLVRHFVRHGSREGRDPSADFSTKGYLERHPELAESGRNPFLHWLTEGRGKGHVASAFKGFEHMAGMLGLTPQRAQDLLRHRRADVRERLASGTLGEMVAEAARLDPLIADTWSEMAQIKIPPFHSDAVVSRVSCLHRLQSAADFARARYVIMVNRPRWGGGRRMEGHIGHALAEIAGAGEVLVITTERSGDMPEGKFPEGVRHIRFAAVTEGLKNDVRQRLLVEFLRSLRPEAVFNVNSRLMWESMAPYGRALSMTTKIVAGLFCNEQTRTGAWTGYPVKHFYRSFDMLDAVCPDSHALARELIHRHMVPPEQRERVVVLEGPVDPALPVASRPRPVAGRRPQVFWSGRFDRQKRLDIAHAVARAMPDIDLRMWGEPVVAGEEPPRAPQNVIHEGPYERFEDLPLGEGDLWLYTAEWDGVPSLLLEVAMTGIPLVGSRVGGTGEVLRDGLSEPIDAIEDVAAYCDGIRRILADPSAARARALRLRETLCAERTPAAYGAAVARALGQSTPHRAAMRAQADADEAA